LLSGFKILNYFFCRQRLRDFVRTQRKFLIALKVLRKNRRMLSATLRPVKARNGICILTSLKDFLNTPPLDSLPVRRNVWAEAPKNNLKDSFYDLTVEEVCSCVCLLILWSLTISHCHPTAPR